MRKFHNTPDQRPSQPHLEQSGSGQLRISRIVIVIGIALAIIYVIASFFIPKGALQQKNELPLIKADTHPTKIVPSQSNKPLPPGQDSLIYDKMAGIDQKPEQILTDKKSNVQPDKPAALHAAKNNDKPAAINDKAKKKDIDSITDLIAKTAVKPLATKSATPPSDNKSARPAVDYILQILVAERHTDAVKLWNKLSQANGDLLSGLSPYYEKIKVNGKDYTRLKAGPFSSSENASIICNKLRERNITCFVVK